MSNQERKQEEPKTTFTTTIGSVTGQVHTGTGDIYVERFSVNSPVANKEDFLALLQQVKNALEEARQKGVSEEVVDDALNECDAVEREAKKEAPKPDRILSRLNRAKEILTASAGVATAVTVATTAISGLIPLLEKAIQVVTHVF